MHPLQTAPSEHDFAPVRAAMQRYVDEELLAGVSWAILRGRDVLDTQCLGWADKEQGESLRGDHIFRAMSNTKLVTSIAVLQLWEEGKFALDDPVARWIPQLANLQVLRPGATRLDDTEPARSAITIRHLLSHSAGLSYGLLDPGTLVYNAYVERRVINTRMPLSNMMDVLATLPLMFHPGTSFEYSVATDVLGYLVEVVSGQTLEQYCAQHIFAPLGMVDSGFVLPADRQGRLTACYNGADLLDPMRPGLKRMEKTLWRGGDATPPAWASGGGGMYSTLPDMVTLVRGLMPGGATILKPATLALMMDNHLPQGTNIRFAQFGEIRGKGYGLGGAVTVKPSSIEATASTGEFQWGGLAGTHWWIHPHTGLAGITMTQRHMGFWHPYFFEFKRLAYQATGH